jgi:DNA-directed RNA polymerase specialized sigma24 family protein
MKNEQPEKNGPLGARDFPETRWSIVVDAADLDSPERTQALESLIEAYLPALRAHLILRRKLQPDAVEDFIQDFVLKKILEQNVVAKADNDRGRFRSFMLKTLDNFVRDYFRSAKPHGQMQEFADEAAPEHSEETPSVFEATWARQVFSNAVNRFKEDCDSTSNDSRWLLFRERLLVPVASGKEPSDYVELAKKCNFESPKQARNAMVGAKRGFDKALHSVVQDYVLDDALVASEIEDLHRILRNSDILDEAVSGFVPLNQELNLTQECFQSVQIAGILEMNKQTKEWTDQELARMWKEILDTTFEKLNLSEACQKVDSSLRPSQSRIRDVLFAAKPSLKILDLLRSYAKAEYGESAEIEDFPCYFVLYTTSIAAAVYKHQQTLSSLPVQKLKLNFKWASEFSWIDPETHEYLEIARRVV